MTAYSLLAFLLVGWVKMPEDIPRDFATSLSYARSSAGWNPTSQGSHTPQLLAFPGPKRSLVIGEVGAWSVQGVTTRDSRLSTVITQS